MKFLSDVTSPFCQHLRSEPGRYNFPFLPWQKKPEACMHACILRTTVDAKKEKNPWSTLHFQPDPKPDRDEKTRRDWATREKGGQREEKDLPFLIQYPRGACACNPCSDERFPWWSWGEVVLRWDISEGKKGRWEGEQLCSVLPKLLLNDHCLNKQEEKKNKKKTKTYKWFPTSNKEQFVLIENLRFSSFILLNTTEFVASWRS